MKLSEIATLSLNRLSSSMKPFGMAPCWEMMITGLLAHELWNEGFTLQLPSGDKADFVSLVGGQFQSNRGERKLIMHNDKGCCTDICLYSPSIAHFEVKTGSAVGSKRSPKRKEIAEDLRRALCVDGYECIIFLLVADPTFYTKLRKNAKKPASTPEWERREKLKNFFPPEEAFGASISTQTSSWEGVDATHLSLRCDLNGGREALLNATVRTSHFETEFT